MIFRFADNCRLAFDDQRKFGEIELIEDVDEFLQTRGLGPRRAPNWSLTIQRNCWKTPRRRESDFA